MSISYFIDLALLFGVTSLKSTFTSEFGGRKETEELDKAFLRTFLHSFVGLQCDKNKIEKLQTFTYLVISLLAD